MPIRRALTIPRRALFCAPTNRWLGSPGLRRGERLAGAPVPSVVERVVDGGPGLAESGRAQVPVWADLGRGCAQVVPQVVEGGAPPEPVAVVDAVYDQSGLEHP